MPGRRCGDAENSGQTDGPGFIPLHRSVKHVERIYLVVLRHHIDIAVGNCRRSAQRSCGTDFPYLAAVSHVERNDIADTIGGIGNFVEHAYTAPEKRRLAITFYIYLGRPDFCTGRSVKGMDHGPRIRDKKPPAGNHRGRCQPFPLAGAADIGGPDL